MKKLSRNEMKKVAGGTVNTLWSCYSASFGGYVLTCSLTDPTQRCSGCGYSDCTNTGTTCGSQSACEC